MSFGLLWMPRSEKEIKRLFEKKLKKSKKTVDFCKWICYHKIRPVRTRQTKEKRMKKSKEIIKKAVDKTKKLW